MSSQALSLFNSIKIETLFNGQNQPWFKRADIGRVLGLKNISVSIPDDMKKEVQTREGILGLKRSYTRLGMYGGGVNSHDVFVSIKLALYIAMRSDKKQAVQVRKWLLDEIIPQGFNKLIDEKDTTLALLNNEIEEKDTALALLNDEIEEKDTEIQVKNEMILELRQRYVDHAKYSGLDNVVMIVRKHTTESEDKRFEYPYYIARIQRRGISVKRRWLIEKFPNSEEIVVIDNANSVHAFNRFEEDGHVERYECHFRLVDLTRDDLYNMGVPAMED